MRNHSLTEFGKAVAGLILALVAAWACAGGVLWQAARVVHYHAMRWGGEEERATDTVRLTGESEVVWINGDELRIDGCMFDVREKRRDGADWLLIGHNDRADNEIFKLLDSLFGLGSGHRGRVKRCALFLPEAIVLCNEFYEPPRMIPAMPLHNPAPAEDWHNVPRSAPEHPPQHFA